MIKLKTKTKLNEDEIKINKKAVNNICYLLIIICTILTAINIKEEQIINAIFVSIYTIFIIFVVINIKYTNSYKKWVKSIIASSSVLSLYLFYHGGLGGSGILWSLVIPFLIFQFIGHKNGLKYIIVYTLLLSAIFLMYILDFIGNDIPKLFLLVYMIIYMTLTAFLYIDDKKRCDTEQLLIENKDKFETLFHNLSFGTILISKEMKILEMNSKIKQWFGLNDSNTKNTHCYNSLNYNIIKDNICSECPVIKTLETGEVYKRIVKKNTVDGIKDFFITSSPLYNENNEIYAVIETLEDITTTLKNKRLLEESENRFQKVFELVSLIPVQGYDKNRNIIFWNTASENIFGYKKQEVMGKKLTI